MNIIKKLFIFITCYVLLVTSKAINRIKRAGGRVEITQQIRPPSKLKKHETPYPPPGWTHCVKKVVATNNWRAISSKHGFKFQTAQFQCTWMISVVKSGIPTRYKRIQISVQKLELGMQDDQNCRQNFLEIIDSGKSQGRFCDKQRPADYVTLGNHVRIDVQGEGTLANLVRAKGRNPFTISYKAVSEAHPGFRSFITKPKNILYDKYHPPSQGIGGGISTAVDRPVEGNKRDKDKGDDETTEEDQFGSLGLTGVIVLALCGTIVAMVILLIFVKQCCCASDKDTTDKEKSDSSSSSEETDNYDLPKSKAVGLPGHPYTQLAHHPSLMTKNEVIITSEIVRPPKDIKPTADTPKKTSPAPCTRQNAKAKSKPIKKVVKSKTTRRRKADVNGNLEKRRIKVVSKPNIRQHNSKRTEAKRHASGNKERRKKREQNAAKERKRRSKSRERKKEVDHEKKEKCRDENEKEKTKNETNEEDRPLRRHPHPPKSHKKSSKKEKKKAPKDGNTERQKKKRKSKERSTKEKENTNRNKKKRSSSAKHRTNTQSSHQKPTTNSIDPTPRTRYKSKSKSRKTKHRKSET